MARWAREKRIRRSLGDGRGEGKVTSDTSVSGEGSVGSCLHARPYAVCDKVPSDSRSDLLPFAVRRPGLCFPYGRRIVGNENCCVVVPGLSKHTSGRKPTFWLGRSTDGLAGNFQRKLLTACLLFWI